MCVSTPFAQAAEEKEEKLGELGDVAGGSGSTGVAAGGRSAREAVRRNMAAALDLLQHMQKHLLFRASIFVTLAKCQVRSLA